MRKAFVRLLVPAFVLTAVVGCDNDPLDVPTLLTVDGTVTEQGAPATVVAGAEVRFALVLEAQDPQWVEATTDAAGEFELHLEAPEGCEATDTVDVRYEVEADGYTPFNSMLLSQSQEVSCGSAPQTFDIEVQAAG